MTITAPPDQMWYSPRPAGVPVSVLAEHGADITTLKLNGKLFDVTGQAIFTQGDGENTADQYVLTFDAVLPLIDLGDVIRECHSNSVPCSAARTSW